jgi:hypothetical protein
VTQAGDTRGRSGGVDAGSASRGERVIDTRALRRGAKAAARVGLVAAGGAAAGAVFYAPGAFGASHQSTYCNKDATGYMTCSNSHYRHLGLNSGYIGTGYAGGSRQPCWDAYLDPHNNGHYTTQQCSYSYSSPYSPGYPYPWGYARIWANVYKSTTRHILGRNTYNNT